MTMIMMMVHMMTDEHNISQSSMNLIICLPNMRYHTLIIMIIMIVKPAVRLWNGRQLIAFSKLADVDEDLTPLFSSVRSEHVIRHRGDIDLIVLASKRDIPHTMVTTTMMMTIFLTMMMMILMI